MGEYEDWARKKAAEDEARKKQQVQNDVTMRQNRLTSIEHAKSARKAEYERVLFPIANKIQSLFAEALRSKFQSAKEHETYQYHETYSGEYPRNSYIAVVAQWGTKLKLTDSEKKIIEGGFSLRKPQTILDHDYDYANCLIYTDYVDAYKDGKRISIADFQQDSNVIFEHIYKRVNNPTHQSETWRLEKNGRYATESAIASQAYYDNQG